MTNYFKYDGGVGSPVTEVNVVLNDDGSVTRTCKLTGAKVNFNFPGATNTEITADVTFEFHIPDTVDATSLYSQGPLKFDQNYILGAWAGEFDVPEQFQ